MDLSISSIFLLHLICRNDSRAQIYLNNISEEKMSH